MDRFGPFVFGEDGELYTTFDAEKEIEKRGGIDHMFAASLEHNAFMRNLMAKKPPKKPKPKPGC